MPDETRPEMFSQCDAFARNRAASAEVRAEAELARIAIDHGCFFLDRLLDTRGAGFELRDWVIVALLRRTLITGEAVRSLLERGLVEPGAATFRTLLELERNLRLVAADNSGRRAHRLAAYGTLKSRHQFKGAPKNPQAREWMFQDEAFFEWFRQQSRKFREWLESEDFQDVAEDMRQARDWHGFNNQEEAFREAGMASDYPLSGFEGTSLFVHATNIDWDYINSEGLRLKPFARGDASLARDLLGKLTLKLILIYILIWEDSRKPEYQDRVVIQDAHGDTHRIPAPWALLDYAMNVVRPRPL